MKFTCQSYDATGKTVASSVEAANAEDARAVLRRQGLFAVSVDRESLNGATVATGGKESTPRVRRVSAGQRLRFVAGLSRQLNVLLASGTPLVQAMNAVERQAESAAWRTALAQLRNVVEEGSPLSEGMRKQPAYFDRVTISIITAGETSGHLSDMLDRLATLSAKQLHLRSMIISALIYPCVLIVIGFCVLTTMLLFVLPRFEILFTTLDTPLPPTTQALMWVSLTLRDYWWAALPIAIVSIIAIVLWIRSESGKRTFDATLLRLPKVGRLARELLTAKLARMLGTLLESKVAMLDALKLTKESSTHAYYERLMIEAENAVGRGEPLSSVLSRSELISPCVQEAISNGEQSGRLGAPLLQMSDFLDQQNDMVMKTLTSMIEPLILVTLGVIVGFMAINMFLPLFDIVSNMSGGAH